MIWLILGASTICAVIVWACCAVAGAADARLDDELDSAFARARFNLREQPTHDLSNGSRSEKAGNVIHERASSATETQDHA